MQLHITWKVRTKPVFSKNGAVSLSSKKPWSFWEIDGLSRRQGARTHRWRVFWVARKHETNPVWEKTRHWFYGYLRRLDSMRCGHRFLPSRKQSIALRKKIACAYAMRIKQRRELPGAANRDTEARKSPTHSLWLMLVLLHFYASTT